MLCSLLAEHVDNSADILYHLAKNRDQVYRLEGLSAHNPSDAIYEIKRLSDSIKANETSFTNQRRQSTIITTKTF